MPHVLLATLSEPQQGAFWQLFVIGLLIVAVIAVAEYARKHWHDEDDDRRPHDKSES